MSNIKNQNKFSIKVEPRRYFVKRISLLAKTTQKEAGEQLEGYFFKNDYIPKSKIRILYEFKPNMVNSMNKIPNQSGGKSCI